VTPQQQLGRNIRAARKRCGMTLRDVEQDTGVSNPSICQWEHGQHSPSAIQLHALACCFGVTLDSFFKGVDFDEKDAA
jgi:transcriptional regulator with XRE-family HTH domain